MRKISITPVYFNPSLIFTIVLITTAAVAQSPCDQTSVTLGSQAEVDQFPSQHCSTMCSLTISGNDITNLDSLYVLENVGSLSITFNPMLANVDGLSHLTKMESSCGDTGLSITSNNILDNLNGLSSITSINGALTISSNTMLSDLGGLRNLTAIGKGGPEDESLTITSNASLVNIDGLNGLTSIPGSVTISSNPGITNINGLGSLTNIGGRLRISYNDALTDLAGLSKLTRVTGDVALEQNSQLTNLHGLQNIDHIGQWSASGMSLEIVSNEGLTTLDGLQGLDTIPGLAHIEGNESLLNLEGLSSVKTFSAPGGSSYNSGLWLIGNNSLMDISAIGGVESIDGGRTSWLQIQSNASLVTATLPNLKQVYGYLLGNFIVAGNSGLKNLDGLSALQVVKGGFQSSMSITDNNSLQNIDGLSSLVQLSGSQGYSLTITNNTGLGSFCGLYNLFHERGTNCGSPDCYSTSGVTISGNETNPTPEEIEVEGPCDATMTQPTNLVFTNITSEGMHVTFNSASTFVSGYLVLMKSFGAPEDVPVDGSDYHVGQMLGGSTIVVHVGADTTVNVTGLVPSTPYYFAVFSWKASADGNDYLTVNPLTGSRSTMVQSDPVANVSFTNVGHDSMTVSLGVSEQGNYIALMRAYGYPSPNDVPVNGKEYRVGNTFGSSTIVVNIGDGSEFTVNGLVPGTKYYFDIYGYDPVTFVYDTHPSQGSESTTTDDTSARVASQEKLQPYPNPFEQTTSIPFVVDQPAAVQVVIYDMTGREIGVLLTGSFDAGRHEASWDGADKDGKRVRPGVYIYSVRSEEGVVTGRVAVR